jgi:hypothetical protein
MATGSAVCRSMSIGLSGQSTAQCRAVILKSRSQVRQARLIDFNLRAWPRGLTTVSHPVVPEIRATVGTRNDPCVSRLRGRLRSRAAAAAFHRTRCGQRAGRLSFGRPARSALVISPFAKAHAIEHAYGDQGSVVKFVNKVFGLPALSNLPDEQKARRAAEYLGKFNYGPDDDTNGITDLLGAFDAQRLGGTRPPLAASYAYVDPYFIHHLPQQTGLGCGTIGIIPVDYLRGIRNNVPADFNPRPGTNPTLSTSKQINTREAVMRARDLDD